METFEITHAYVKDEEIWRVTSPMKPEEFEQLLAYILFQASEINEDTTLIPMDMVKRVLPLYGCERTFDDILDDDEHEFDMHWTWENFCGKYYEVLKMEKFHHPELKQVLTKIFEEIKAEEKKFDEESKRKQ